MDSSSPQGSVESKPAAETNGNTCPQCGAAIQNPAIGYCLKCGYFRAEGETPATPAPAFASEEAQLPPPQSVSELLGRLPQWFWWLLIGVAAVVALSVFAMIQFQPSTFPRALWSTIQLGVGVVLFLVAQLWALMLVTHYDDTFGAKDVFIPGRLWGVVIKRLPLTRRPLCLGAWSGTAVLCSVFLIGSLFFWIENRRGKKANSGVDFGYAAQSEGDLTMEEALNEVAKAGGAVTGKDKEDPEAEAAKGEPVWCIVIGYLPKEKEKGFRLVLGTRVAGRLRYVGIVEHGIPPDKARQIQERLDRLVIEEPPIPGLKFQAVWVSPELTCNVYRKSISQEGIYEGLSYKAFTKD